MNRIAALQQLEWLEAVKQIYSLQYRRNLRTWGPLHGGANQEVLEMLEHIRADGGDYKKYMNMAKDKTSGFKLMGFGHRVYKNFDPRAKILKVSCDKVLGQLGNPIRCWTLPKILKTSH